MKHVSGARVAGNDLKNDEVYQQADGPGRVRNARSGPYLYKHSPR